MIHQDLIVLLVAKESFIRIKPEKYIHVCKRRILVIFDDNNFKFYKQTQVFKNSRIGITGHSMLYTEKAGTLQIHCN